MIFDISLEEDRQILILISHMINLFNIFCMIKNQAVAKYEQVELWIAFQMNIVKPVFNAGCMRNPINIFLIFSRNHFTAVWVIGV